MLQEANHEKKGKCNEKTNEERNDKRANRYEALAEESEAEDKEGEMTEEKIITENGKFKHQVNKILDNEKIKVVKKKRIFMVTKERERQ